MFRLIKENFSIYSDNVTSVSVFKRDQHQQCKSFKFYQDHFQVSIFKATLKLFNSRISFKYPVIFQIFGPKNDKRSVPSQTDLTRGLENKEFYFKIIVRLVFYYEDLMHWRQSWIFVISEYFCCQNFDIPFMNRNSRISLNHHYLSLYIILKHFA